MKMLIRNATSDSTKMYPVGATSGCLLGAALLLLVNSTAAFAELPRWYDAPHRISNQTGA
jgi:hypothetical protein